jgi:hypothetical protein
VYSYSEKKKNQGRFRHVGSDHSLFSLTRPQEVGLFVCMFIRYENHDILDGTVSSFIIDES